MTPDTYDNHGGTIDASWQTAPWNRDGETIPKETENQEGNITMTELPEEVDADDLTDTQERIIRTAVRNPEFSTTDVERVADVSTGYSSLVLRDKCPNWYAEVFLTQGKSTDPIPTAEDADYPHPEELESVEDETEYKRKTIPATDSTEASDSSPEPDSSEWQSYAVVALLSFVVGLLWGGRDE